MFGHYSHALFGRQSDTCWPSSIHIKGLPTHNLAYDSVKKIASRGFRVILNLFAPDKLGHMCSWPVLATSIWNEEHPSKFPPPSWIESCGLWVIPHFSDFSSGWGRAGLDQLVPSELYLAKHIPIPSSQSTGLPGRSGQTGQGESRQDRFWNQPKKS